MQALEKWVERVYAETDFGRSIATSTAGVVGLGTYLAFSDWVIGAFAAIIAFPVVRIAATGIHERLTRKAKLRIQREEAERLYAQLSDGEKQVVLAFVREGGCVMTWDHVNRLSLPGPSVESLAERGLMRTSVRVDGMTETFVLDEALFEVGQDYMDDIPF